MKIAGAAYEDLFLAMASKCALSALERYSHRNCYKKHDTTLLVPHDGGATDSHWKLKRYPG